MPDPTRPLFEDPEVDEHYADAPATLSETDRALALLQGPPKMSRQAITWVLIACAVLGLGGVVGEHFFGGGASVVAKPPTTTTTNLSPQADLHAPLAAMMGLQSKTPRSAPAFSLEESNGKTVSLASFRGDVVVLSFFDSACDDICPILADELATAGRDLGTEASKVVFLVVNTDPLAISAGSVSPVLHNYLGSKLNWHFLTGSIAQLNPVWSAYGVTIDVQRTSNLVAHNDVMYFIDPAGRLRMTALPFANETVKRVFSLPVALEQRWGSGIATEARALLDAHS